MIPELYNYDDKINNITYDEPNGVKGLVIFLNNLIYKYINIFMDPTSKKIYRPLIEKLVLGVNSNEVMNNNSILDGTAAFPEGKVIFQSIANALKNIMTIQHDKISGTSLKFVEDNFVNINEYNKELLRAHLPTFKKEFEILLQKASFLKNVIE